MQKVTSREQQASDTIIFTQDLHSPTYIVTQTCTHSCIPRHTWIMHTLEIPLGIQILAPSEMPGQARGTRGSHPGGGHGLWLWEPGLLQDARQGRYPNLLTGPVWHSHPSPGMGCTRGGTAPGGHTNQARVRGEHWTARLTSARHQTHAHEPPEGSGWASLRCLWSCSQRVGRTLKEAVQPDLHPPRWGIPPREDGIGGSGR